MSLDYPFFQETSLKLFVSLVLGASIGAEREYKGRNIGFRTIILVTLGSTFFTIISFIIGEKSDPSRVASNIVTGIGFLGAGAIFRDGLNVKGVTTASIIWIGAAIGMACGIGQFELAITVTLIVLMILLGFAWVQQFIDRYNKELIYRITIPNDLDLKARIETDIYGLHLRFIRVSHTKVDDNLIIIYEISGREKNHNLLIDYLSVNGDVKSFNV
jgi:putative Mg2+ transporter-C (MgtC) family protein